MAKIYNFKEHEFNLKNLPPSKKINIDWSRTGDKDASSMHSIASYLAMFAPAMPKYFIEKLTSVGDLIYDPFSGRGTTALKAREMNRNFVGSDLNPYALVLSRSKVSVVSKEKSISFVNKMENDYNIWILKNKNIYRRKCFFELRYYYSPKVLSQLIYIREIYGQKWRNFNDVKNLVFGIILGLMHGKIRKNGTTMYFSLDMPNTISMSPNYVKKYSKNNNLKRPIVNIFNLIRDRINKKYDNLLLKPYNSTIYEKNALEINNKIKKESVSLLITSPPYLSIVNYTDSNWLKLWLLGYERKNLRKEIVLSDRLKYNQYIKFIINFLNNAYSKIKKGGYVALIVGDVYEKKLIEEIWNEIKNIVNFKLINIYWDDKYLQEKKITNMLNNRKGKATKIEKVLLLRKL